MIMHTRRFKSNVYRVDGRAGQRADFRYASENLSIPYHLYYEGGFVLNIE